ncbi:MAG: translation elongation factor-like protein [Candidatus Portnoybacteria bacterium]|nr:translation elongation factor-like protein [Candidatus Portnoybacteria bacterium]
MSEENFIGKISHYYPNIGVGIVDLEKDLAVGDKIHVRGKASDFEQTIDSMQIEHESVGKAGAGQAVGIKMAGKAKSGDLVYKAKP